MTRLILDIIVPGKTYTQGSKQIMPKRGGRGYVLIENNKKHHAQLKKWREEIAWRGLEDMRKRASKMVAGPVQVSILIYAKRPLGHFKGRSRANPLLVSAPDFPEAGDDIDKVARAVLDALTQVAYTDDSRVIDLSVRRRYHDMDSEGTMIRVERWKNGE